MNLARCCVCPHTKPVATVSGPHSRNCRLIRQPRSKSQFITFSLRFYEACRITASGAGSISEVCFFFLFFSRAVWLHFCSGEDGTRSECRGLAPSAAEHTWPPSGESSKLSVASRMKSIKRRKSSPPAILLEENKRSLSQMLHGAVRSSSHGRSGV